MKRSVNVGSILGIRIALHYTWFLIFGAVFFILAKFYFPAYHPDWSQLACWLVGFVTAGLFFASVLIHELAHSLVAQRRGIPVQDITLFILGGVSNIKKEADSPNTELAIAAAGPAMSVVLAGFFIGVWYLSRELSEQVSALAFYLGVTNGMLALFNTIPGFPLDGGRMLRATLWRLTDNFRSATRIASLAGRFLAYLFVLTGLVMALTGNWMNGVWMIFMGWFLQNAAESAYEHSVTYDILKGVSVAEVMSRDYPTIEEYLTLKQLSEDYMSRYNLMTFPVVHGSKLIGAVSIENIKRVPKESWEATPVAEVMTSVETLDTLDPAEEVEDALERLGEGEAVQLPVVERGRLVGLLSKGKILQFINLKEGKDKAA